MKRAGLCAGGAAMRVASIFAAFALCTSLFSTATAAGPHGEFRGEVVTRWLDDARRMQLVKDFAYIAPDDVVWDAPAGWVIDGASIPRVAWSIVGGPYEGVYRRASVIHDVACDRKDRPWKLVHRAFYSAMLAAGVEPMKAKLMYAAVYYGGPRWDSQESVIASSFDGPGAAESIYSSRHGITPDGSYILPSAPPDGTSASTPSFSAVLFFEAHEDELLSEEQFEILRAKIETSGLSIEEIEAYRPG